MQNGSSVQSSEGVRCKMGALCNALGACSAKWGQRAVLSGCAMHVGGVQCKRRTACNALRVCNARGWGGAMQKENGVQFSEGLQCTGGV